MTRHRTRHDRTAGRVPASNHPTTGDPAGAGRLATDNRGAVAAFAAIGAVVLLGFAALGLDVGHAYVEQSRLQTATDAAALAAAGLIGPNSASQVMARARQYAARNLSSDPNDANPPLTGATISVDQGRWDAARRIFTVTNDAPDAVRIVARRSETAGKPVNAGFAALFGHDHFDISVQAIATRRRAVCLLALEPAAAKAVELSGGSDIDMPDCGVQINSSGAPALRGSGNASITAASICVVGGVSVDGTVTPAPEPACAPIADPLAGLAAPAYGACDHNGYSASGGTRTLSPGVYCGGIELKGGASGTFQPGIYVIKDGPLKTSGGSSITGDGVAFYLVGAGAVVNVSGGGAVHLKAPRTGPLTGLIFAQGPGVAAGATSKLSGGSEMFYEGTIHLPGHKIELSGGSTGTAPPYTIFIAKSLLISGGGALTVNADFAASDVPVAVPGVGRGTALVR